MKIKLLWISIYFAINNEYGEGGAKTHWNNLNIMLNDNRFENKLITFRMEYAKQFPSPIPDSIITEINMNIFKRLYRFLYEYPLYLNPIEKSAGHLSRYRQKIIETELKKLKKNGYCPDIIILEWTETVLFVRHIKRAFGNSKIVASLHDVCFQKMDRMYDFENNIMKKFFLRIRKKRFKQLELKSYRLCDLVLPHNTKDSELLINEGIEKEKLGVIQPYYRNYSFCKPNYSKIILFWGAMWRIENHQACIWFIDNVFKNLIKNYPDLIFVIAGKDPKPDLLSMQSKNINVTGILKNPEKVFEDSLCLVAPLSMGGGIKIKVLEALSSGIPVLSNKIGMEGINATSGVHYYHCEEPSDYEQTIIKLIDNPDLAKTIGNNGRDFINRNFNQEEGNKKLPNYLIRLVQNKTLTLENN